MLCTAFIFYGYKKIQEKGIKGEGKKEEKDRTKARRNEEKKIKMND